MMVELTREHVWVDTCFWDPEDRPLCCECEARDRCLVNQKGLRSIQKSPEEELAEEFGR